MWPYKSTHRVVHASTTRRAGVVGANQCRGSPQRFCIPIRTRALATRARTWVAKEVFGHRGPHAGVVRASTTRPAGVMGANKWRGSPQHFCIPIGPRALVIRARTWVARSMWPLKSTHRVVRASTTRPAGLVGANQRRASSQRFYIPIRTRALAIRALTWVAKEVFGHRSPHTG